MDRLIGFLALGRHRRLRDLLSAYVDGEVTGSERRRVEGHLESCDVCRAELEDLRATVSALRRMPELAVPRSFALSPEQAVAQRPVMAGGRTLRLAASGAAVFLLGLIVADLLGAGIEQLPSMAPLERAGTDEVVREVVVEKEVAKAVPVERQAMLEAAAEVEVEKIVTVEVERVVEAEKIQAVEVEKIVTSEAGAEEVQAVEAERVVVVEKALVATPTPLDEQVARLQVEPESEVAVEMAIAADTPAPAGADGAPEEELAMAAADVETPSPTPEPEPAAERVVVAASPVRELGQADAPAIASPADDQGTTSRRTWPVRQLEIAVAALLAVLIVLTVWTRRRRV